MQSSQQPLASEHRDVDPVPVDSGFLTGAALAMMFTGIAGGTALLLFALSPWAGWGYAGLALAAGIGLELLGRGRSL